MVLACTSCDRSTRAPAAEGMVTAGMSGADDRTSQGGDDAASASICSGSGPSCLKDCVSFATVTDAVCVDARWTCPPGTLAYDDCPADACVRRTPSCCAPNGEVARPDCTADGAIGACPEGFGPVNGKCLPQGVPIEDCSELQPGQACTDGALVCYTSKCSRNCYCKADDAGNLTWSCYALPC